MGAPSDSGLRRSFLYRATKTSFNAAFGTLCGFKVSGLEHIPAAGPLIVAGNHIGWIDGPYMSVVVSSQRSIHFLGKAELFRFPIFAGFIRRMGVMPLERKKGDVEAMRRALDILKDGGCMGYFPEGTRSRSGEPGQPKPGLGFLASHSQALVVPARLVNTERCLFRRPLEIRFGPGLRYESEATSRQDFFDFSRKIMDRVFAL